MTRELLDAENTEAGVVLSVRHQTKFTYAANVRESVNTLRLVPKGYPKQETLCSLVKVLPATRLRSFEDLNGNIVHHFEISREHRRLEIESNIKVRTFGLAVTEEAKSASLHMLDIEDIRETTLQYTQPSRRVSSNPEIWRKAVDLTLSASSVYGKATAIMEWIHEEFSYVAGVTNVETHLETGFELKKGVCQDFAHVMLGLARSIGIPARYASGYLYNGPLDSLLGSQASHAWCEVFVPNYGWLGFDPTNNKLADERYVKIAVGRDYSDVAPIQGSYLGTSECHMEVHVVVERG